MSLPLNACPDCRSLTSGDCGKHGVSYPLWTTTPMPKTRVITRKVPMTCGVCEGAKFVPELPDEDDSEFLKCEPCGGQGWLWITENMTEQYDGSKHQPGCRAEDGFPCHCLAHNDGGERG